MGKVAIIHQVLDEAQIDRGNDQVPTAAQLSPELANILGSLFPKAASHEELESLYEKEHETLLTAIDIDEMTTEQAFFIPPPGEIPDEGLLISHVEKPPNEHFDDASGEQLGSVVFCTFPSFKKLVVFNNGKE
jgi:hypothetical protein